MLRLRKSWHAVFVRLRAREYETTMRQKINEALSPHIHWIGFAQIPQK
jgi:hypothetical protein